MSTSLLQKIEQEAGVIILDALSPTAKALLTTNPQATAAEISTALVGKIMTFVPKQYGIFADMFEGGVTKEVTSVVEPIVAEAQGAVNQVVDPDAPSGETESASADTTARPDEVEAPASETTAPATTYGLQLVGNSGDVTPLGGSYTEAEINAAIEATQAQWVGQGTVSAVPNAPGA